MVSMTETKVLPEKEEQKKSKLVKYGQTLNLNLGCLGMVSELHHQSNKIFFCRDQGLWVLSEIVCSCLRGSVCPVSTIKPYTQRETFSVAGVLCVERVL